MDITLYAILISLIPAFGWGIGNALQKPIVRAIGATNLIIYRGIIVSLITGGFLLYNLPSQKFDLQYILIGSIITLISYFGLFYLNKGLEKGDIGVVIPISSSRVIISTLVAITFLNDRLNALQILCIGVIFIGIIASTINLRKFRNSDIFNFQSGIPYAMLAALFWGVGLALFSIPSAVLGVFLFTFLVEIINLLIAVGHNIISRKHIDLQILSDKKLFSLTLIMGILNSLASLFAVMGYATGKVSIVTTVTSSSPLISIIFGMLFLKEKLKTQQLISGLIIVAGIILLGYFS